MINWFRGPHEASCRARDRLLFVTAALILFAVMMLASKYLL